MYLFITALRNDGDELLHCPLRCVKSAGYTGFSHLGSCFRTSPRTTQVNEHRGTQETCREISCNLRPLALPPFNPSRLGFQTSSRFANAWCKVVWEIKLCWKRRQKLFKTEFKCCLEQRNIYSKVYSCVWEWEKKKKAKKNWIPKL